MLVCALELHQFIDSKDPSLHIFDCRYALPTSTTDKVSYGKACYDKGHIPQAQFVDIDTMLTGAITATSGRHPLPTHTDFNIQLQTWGLSPNSKVIIYADKGNLFAARLWWMLHRWANIPDVSLLDGGFSAWQDAQLPLSDELPTLTVSTHHFHFDDNEYVDMQTVQTAITKKRTNFITDARATSRFNGEPSTIDSVLGHIPGAVNYPCQQNIDKAGYFQPKDQLAAHFASLVQHNAPECVLHSCGSGLTACHNAFAMELAGFDDYKIYIGSWSQWTQFADNPIEK